MAFKLFQVGFNEPSRWCKSDFRESIHALWLIR